MSSLTHRWRLLTLLVPLAGLVLAAPPASSQSTAAERDRDRVAERTVPVLDEDREVHEMSDLEMARLAAGSPDQHPLGFVLQPYRVEATALNWGFLGPRPMLKEYWSGNANAGGRVASIAVDPRNGNVVYIAAAQGGVWKSVDGGTTWNPLTDFLSSLASGALAFDPINPDILYYGTGEQHYSGDSFYGDGLFRTSNAGATWSKIAPKTSVGSYIARVAIKPTDPNLLFVASDLGVVRSTDGGSIWTVTLAGGHCNDIAIDPVTPTTVFAAIRGVGIYKSLDDGATWTLLAGGLPTTGFLRINFGMSRSNPQVLYASFVSSGSDYGALLGMFKTTNGGASWTQLTSTPNYLRSQGWYDNCVMVDPANSNVCYAGGVFPYVPGFDFGLIKTIDGGATWTDITKNGKGQLHPDQHFLLIGPDGTLWVANDGGIWKSTNGGTRWTNCNAGLGLAQLYATGLHPTDANVMLAGTQDNGTLHYTGTVGWPQLKEGDGGQAAVEWANPSIWYSTYVDFNPLYRWTNNGKNFSIVTGGWTADRTSHFNGPLVIDPNVASTLLVGTYRVWKSSNGGTSWTTVSPDLTTGSGHLRSLAVMSGNSSTMLSGSSDGLAYLTTDGGSSWTLRNAGLPAAKLPSMIFDPTSSSIAYTCADVSTGPRVFVTGDAGVNWTSITGNLPDGVRALALTVDFRFSPARLYVGTDYGLYSSIDAGVTWINDSANLPNCAIYEVHVDVPHNRIVAATHGRGEWAAVLSTTAPQLALTAPPHDGGSGGALPATAAAADRAPVLYPFTPNPPRLPVDIEFTLAQPGVVSLELFDVLGRRVRSLDEGYRGAGRHAVRWDGRDAAGRAVREGVYFARLRGPDFERVARLAITR